MGREEGGVGDGQVLKGVQHEVDLWCHSCFWRVVILEMGVWR
jgi:hypothetical protein